MKPKVKILKPKLPRHLPPLEFINELEEEQYLSHGVISDCTIDGAWGGKVYIEQVQFENVSMEGISFNQVELTDVVFENCNLSNVDFSEAVFHRVEMKNCKLVGGNFSGTTLRNVLLDSCMANYLALGDSNCKEVRFQKSSMLSADFYESTLKKVELLECDINEANLTGVELQGMDLSSCNFEKLVISFDKLEGCIVSPEQAIGFARALGLVVNEAGNRE